MSLFRWGEPSLIERIAIKVLARFTFLPTGLRVDGSGATQPVSGTITANAGTGNWAQVTLVPTVTVVQGLGRNTQDGQGIQNTQLNFQSGFRRNLSVT